MKQEVEREPRSSQRAAHHSEQQPGGARRHNAANTGHRYLSCDQIAESERHNRIIDTESRARGSAGECHGRMTNVVRRQTLRRCNETVNSDQRTSVSLAGAPPLVGRRNVMADSETESVVSRASPEGKPFNLRMYATVAA